MFFYCEVYDMNLNRWQHKYLNVHLITFFCVKKDYLRHNSRDKFCWYPLWGVVREAPRHLTIIFRRMQVLSGHGCIGRFLCLIEGGIAMVSLLYGSPWWANHRRGVMAAIVGDLSGLGLVQPLLFLLQSYAYKGGGGAHEGKIIPVPSSS